MALVTTKVRKSPTFKDLSVGDSLTWYFLDSKMLSSLSDDKLIKLMDQMSSNHVVKEISKEDGIVVVTLDDWTKLVDTGENSIVVIQNKAANNVKIWNCYSMIEYAEDVLDFVKYMFC